MELVWDSVSYFLTCIIHAGYIHAYCSGLMHSLASVALILGGLGAYLAKFSRQLFEDPYLLEIMVVLKCAVYSIKKYNGVFMLEWTTNKMAFPCLQNIFKTPETTCLKKHIQCKLPQKEGYNYIYIWWTLYCTIVRPCLSYSILVNEKAWIRGYTCTSLHRVFLNRCFLPRISCNLVHFS